MRRITWIAGWVAACGTAANLAADGKIPIFDATVINQPGHYVVTRDISTSGPSPVITIGGAGCAPFGGVTLDLNGHTLATSVAVDVIRIDTLCVRRGVTIRNGRIVGAGSASGLGAGILSTAVAQIEVRIENVRIESVGGAGIEIKAARIANVLNCRVHDVGDIGILVSGLVGPFRGRFAGNTIDSTQWGGLTLVGLNGGQVKDNVITNFGLNPGSVGGIYLSSAPAIGDIVGGNLVEGNSVSSLPGGTNDHGIIVHGLPGYACSRNMLVGNSLQRNGASGAWIQSDGNRIERNVLSRNGLNGIQIGNLSGGSYNHVEGNSAQGNSASCGLIIVNGNSHSYRNNAGGGNGVIGAGCISAGNLDQGGNTGL